MSKKLCAVLLAASMTISFSGCSGLPGNILNKAETQEIQTEKEITDENFNMEFSDNFSPINLPDEGDDVSAAETLGQITNGSAPKNATDWSHGKAYSVKEGYKYTFELTPKSTDVDIRAWLKKKGAWTWTQYLPSGKGKTYCLSGTKKETIEYKHEGDNVSKYDAIFFAGYGYKVAGAYTGKISKDKIAGSTGNSTEQIFADAKQKAGAGLGASESGIERTQNNKGYKQSFSGASGAGKGIIILKDGSSQAFWVHGAIYDRYIDLGGTYQLGFPTANEVKSIKNSVYQKFDGGGEPSLHYYDGKTFLMRSGIRQKWLENSSSLGLPISDEISLEKANGAVQAFEGGALTWTPQSGASISTKETFNFNAALTDIGNWSTLMGFKEIKGAKAFFSKFKLPSSITKFLQITPNTTYIDAFADTLSFISIAFSMYKLGNVALNPNSTIKERGEAVFDVSWQIAMTVNQTLTKAAPVYAALSIPVMLYEISPPHVQELCRKYWQSGYWVHSNLSSKTNFNISDAEKKRLKEEMIAAMEKSQQNTGSNPWDKANYLGTNTWLYGN